jgi:hypothetical protein
LISLKRFPPKVKAFLPEPIKINSNPDPADRLSAVEPLGKQVVILYFFVWGVGIAGSRPASLIPLTNCITG